MGAVEHRLQVVYLLEDVETGVNTKEGVLLDAGVPVIIINAQREAVVDFLAGEAEITRLINVVCLFCTYLYLSYVLIIITTTRRWWWWWWFFIHWRLLEWFNIYW